jgi:hypothetical protein
MAGHFFLGLYLAIIVAAVGWEVSNWHVRRRCRTCGRGRALRRFSGARRVGFVRLRCRYCGAKHWSVIDGEGSAGSKGPHVVGPLAAREGRFVIGTRAFRTP